MIPEMLQDDLVDECKRLFAEDRFKVPKTPDNPEGNPIQINVFPQSLPIAYSDEDDDPVPYIIVRIVNGIDEGKSDSKHSVRVDVIIGMYDDESSAQGHRSVMHIINTLYKRFMTNPNLNDKYVYDGPFEWGVQDDAYYPFYFGAVKMQFTIPAIRREVEFV